MNAIEVALKAAIVLLTPTSNTDTPRAPLRYADAAEAIKDALDRHLPRAQSRLRQIGCTAPQGYAGTCYCEPECHGPTCPQWGKDGWGWQDHVKHNPSSHEDE